MEPTRINKKESVGSIRASEPAARCLATGISSFSRSDVGPPFVTGAVLQVGNGSSDGCRPTAAPATTTAAVPSAAAATATAAATAAAA